MAATGTPTTNIGLRRPQGTDPASVDDINYNSELIDTKLGAVGDTSLQAQVTALNSNTAKKGYVQKLSATEYTIPIATLQANHSYGIALVGAYTSLFALFFINNNTATITRLSGNLTASITNTTETEITLTFSSTVWDGITVMPL